MKEDEDVCLWSQECAVLEPKWSFLPLISGSLLEITLLCRSQKENPFFC